MRKRFIDRDHQPNYDKGVSYYASGLVDEDYTIGGVGSGSGKDYSVTYIDPFGACLSEWRSVGEVDLFDIDDCDYMALLEVYKAAPDTPYVDLGS
jgi:hypothetical protein